MKIPCSIDDCDEPQRGRSWCWRHYQRWYRHGNPEHPKNAHSYPWKAVEDYVHRHWTVGASNVFPFYPGDHMPAPRMCDILEMDDGTLCVYRKAGYVSDVVADHVAIRLGVHPVAIWPTWFTDVELDDDDETVALSN